MWQDSLSFGIAGFYRVDHSHYEKKGLGVSDLCTHAYCYSYKQNTGV